MKYFLISILFTLNIYAIEYLKDIKEPYKLDYIDRAKNYVEFLLKDKSIKFEKVYYNKGLTGIELICGEIKKDTKNDRFIYITDEFTFIENLTKDFGLIWEQLCKYDNRAEEYYRIDKPLIPIEKEKYGQ